MCLCHNQSDLGAFCLCRTQRANATSLWSWIAVCAHTTSCFLPLQKPGSKRVLPGMGMNRSIWCTAWTIQNSWQCQPIRSKQQNGNVRDPSWPDCAGILKSLLCYELEREIEEIVVNINLCNNLLFHYTVRKASLVWEKHHLTVSIDREASVMS